MSKQFCFRFCFRYIPGGSSRRWVHHKLLHHYKSLGFSFIITTSASLFTKEDTSTLSPNKFSTISCFTSKSTSFQISNKIVNNTKKVIQVTLPALVLFDGESVSGCELYHQTQLSNFQNPIRKMYINKGFARSQLVFNLILVLLLDTGQG